MKSRKDLYRKNIALTKSMCNHRDMTAYFDATEHNHGTKANNHGNNGECVLP